MDDTNLTCSTIMLNKEKKVLDIPAPGQKLKKSVQNRSKHHNY